jgi:DNA repair protein RadC
MKHILKENRPRERLMHSASSLSSAELLAIILKSGTQKENVLEISHKILQKFGSRLQYCSVQELSQEHGIGIAKACQIVALFEFHKRIPKDKRITVNSAKDVAKIFSKKLQNNQKEHFIALYLDVKGNILSEKTVTIGLANASLAHPREVFHGAIKSMAHSVIVIHNHPSGDPTPSEEDLLITEKLEESGEIVGINLIDHVIIGKGSYWSWNENQQKI